MFERAGKKNRNFGNKIINQLRFGHQKIFEHKLKYIHNNPVAIGFVTNPIDWEYSSVRNHVNNDHTILEIDLN